MGLTRRFALAAAVALVAATLAPTASAHDHRQAPTTPTASTLVTFAAPGCATACGSGSTVGPDGFLYVTDGPGGRVLRVNPETGATTTYASGLPKQRSDSPIGGAMDVAFLDHTAYVLVTVVGPFFGDKTAVDGIYRVRSDGTATPVADIGAWSIAHPPKTDFFVGSGVQYAMEPYRDGFLVTDGHHNRVLWVSTHGFIKEVATFDDIVPTGLEADGDTVLMSEAGPIPHRPADGKIVELGHHGSAARTVASGAPLLVDVELGHDGLYALSQGVWTLPQIPANEGMPASANTGRLVKVEHGGTFSTVIGGLDRPTSMDFIGCDAYVVTLTGKVVKVHDFESCHHDDHHGEHHGDDD